MRVIITSYAVENQGVPGTYEISSTCRLYVGNTELTNGGASITGMAGTNHRAIVKFGSAVIGGTQYFGVFPGCEYDNGDETHVEFYSGVFVSSNFFQGSLTPAFSGGAAGSSPNGGVGDNDTTHTNPDSITAAVKMRTGDHGLHVYRITSTEYEKLIGKIWGLEGMISNWFSKPFDNIVSVHIIPYLSNYSYITNQNPRIARAVFTDVTCDEFTTYEYQQNSAWIPIGTTDNTFMDWQNTKATIYLPFCGTYPIDIRMIMGGAIKVDYFIDVIQGNCVATVWGRNYEGHSTILGTYSGNCAVPLPITGASANSGIIPGVITTTAGIGAAVLTGGVSQIASIGALTQDATNVASALGEVVAAGNLQGNSAGYASTQILLNLIRPRPIWQSKEAEIKGRPSGKDDVISAFSGSGFLSGSIHPSGTAISATDAEINEIKSLFKGGVYV